MNPFSLLDRRYRGFRVIEIGGLGVLLVLALVVYLAKTHAGGERADIDHIQAQIDDEQARVTLLRAEVAKLEQPERLETLSGRYLNLQPIPPGHEISAEALASVAHPAPAPAPAVKTAPQPAPSAAPASAAPNAPAAAVAAADPDAPQ
jgi:cell division protein FtsL